MSDDIEKILEGLCPRIASTELRGRILGMVERELAAHREQSVRSMPPVEMDALRTKELQSPEGGPGLFKVLSMATTKSDPPPTTPHLPPLSAEHRRICAERFQKANAVIAAGDFSYAIALILPCCKLDPANFLYRQTLRRTQKAKYPNKKGSSMAWLTTLGARGKLKKAKRSREHLKVLEFGEEILSKDPWDLDVQMDMGAAAEAAGLSDIAVFILDQARQKFPKNAKLNRQLARLFEKRGNFGHAITLWQLVAEVAPKDVEAQAKSKELAACETIQKGGYDSGEQPALPLHFLSGGTAGKTNNKKEEKPVERVDREAAPILARIQTSPADPNQYLQLAAVYRRYHQPDRARLALEMGLGPTDSHYLLMLELMEMEIEPFRKDLAITDEKIRMSGKKAVGADEDEDSTLSQLERMQAKLIKEILAREIELFRLKSDRYPLEANHRLDLGARLLQADLVEQAVKELQIARKDQTIAGKACIFLGICFLKVNKWGLAQRNFEEALNLLPGTDEDNRKEVLFQLAIGHAAAGDLAKAIELGHELANLDFSYKDINKLVDKWQEKLQDQ